MTVFAFMILGIGITTVLLAFKQNKNDQEKAFQDFKSRLEQIYHCQDLLDECQKAVIRRQYAQKQYKKSACKPQTVIDKAVIIVNPRKEKQNEN